jgi:hypothetical protein
MQSEINILSREEAFDTLLAVQAAGAVATLSQRTPCVPQKASKKLRNNLRHVHGIAAQTSTYFVLTLLA